MTINRCQISTLWSKHTAEGDAAQMNDYGPMQQTDEPHTHDVEWQKIYRMYDVLLWIYIEAELGRIYMELVHWHKLQKLVKSSMVLEARLWFVFNSSDWRGALEVWVVLGMQYFLTYMPVTWVYSFCTKLTCLWSVILHVNFSKIFKTLPLMSLFWWHEQNK